MANGIKANSSLSDRVIIVERAVETLSQDIIGLENRMNANFAELKTIFHQNDTDATSSKRFTMILFATACPILLAVLTGLWFTITLQMQAYVAPIAAKVELLVTNYSQVLNTENQFAQDINIVKSQNASSIEDRHHINESITNIQEQLIENAKLIAKNDADRKIKEIEIDTKFALGTQARNGESAAQQRLNAIMWNKIPDLGKYPDGPFTEFKMNKSE